MRVAARSVEFAYGEGDFRLQVPELDIASGEHAAIVGASSCGKTTLLRLLAGIIQPQTGEVAIGEFPLNELDEDARRAFRIQNVGFVFQDFRLIDYLDVRENIRLPWRLNPALQWTASTEDRLAQIATDLRLADQLDAPVDQLSTGEQQRTAIARAMLPQPGLILADEPTGNLDPENKTRILDLLLKQAGQTKATLLMATHDHALLDRLDRTLDFAQFTPEAAHA